MITKLTEQKGCIIAEFIDLKRFTLAVTEEVKSELKPILSQEGNKMIFDFKNIEFIDSSGIGCIISLVKTAKSNHSEIKLCNISRIMGKCNNSRTSMTSDDILHNLI